MFERWLQMGFLRAPEGGEGGEGGGDDGGGEKKPPADAGDGGGAGEDSTFATFKTQEAFDERMARSTRAELKKLGITDPEAFKAEQEELKELRAAKKKTNEEAMSEQERLTAQLTESKAKEIASERAASSALKRVAVVERCARLGVKDIDYAAFRLGQLSEDEDQDAWLAKTLEDPQERARFGVDGDAAPKPANTSTGGGAGDPPASKKPSGAKESGAKSVSDMNAEEFRAYKAEKHGIHS